MVPELSIREFQDEDASAAANLFFEAVQTGAKAAYTQEQRNAWAPAIPDVATWRDRMAAQYSVMAYQGGELLGFMTLTKVGVIDLAFVHPRAMGSGVAGKLYDVIIKEARARKLPTLQTRASHMARRFFEKRDWSVVQQQTAVRGDVELINFRMEFKIKSEDSTA
ncbi:MAG: GNAT family N-acetyltransferase [Alphaproteobacteria bacterium]